MGSFEYLKAKHPNQSSQHCLGRAPTMSTGLQRKTQGQSTPQTDAGEYTLRFLRKKEAPEIHTDAESTHSLSP